MNRRGFFGRFASFMAAPAAVAEAVIAPAEKAAPALPDLKEYVFEHLPRGKERATKAVAMLMAARRNGLRMKFVGEPGIACELPTGIEEAQ